MNVQLNTVVTGLDGATLTRENLRGQPNAATSSGTNAADNVPLTLAYMIAHILSTAVEDLHVLDQAAAQAEAAQYQGLPADQVDAALTRARALRAKASAEKLARGQLALRLAAAESEAIDLSAADQQRILEVCVPRMLPVVLAQLNTVIN